MRVLSILLSTSYLSTALPAQFLTAVAPVGVFTASSGSPTQFAGVAPGALLGSLNLSTSPSGGGFNAAGLWVGYPTVGLHSSTFRCQSDLAILDTAPRSAGTTRSGAGTGAVPGPVEFTLRYAAAAGRAGELRLTASGNSTQTATTTSLVNQVTIDVDADGTPELTSFGSQVVVPVVFPVSGEIFVKVTVENHAAGTGFIVSSSTTDVEMHLEPVMVVPYGSGCGGASSIGATSGLVATANGYTTVTLTGIGGFSNSLVVSAFGTTDVGPLLPGGCGLLTDAAILVPILSDGAGAATQTFDLHAAVTGVLYQQFVPIDFATFSFRASNGLSITAW